MLKLDGPRSRHVRNRAAATRQGSSAGHEKGVFMRLSNKALAVAFGLLWGGAIFLVAIINLANANYGADFLRGMGSVYPGFYHSRNFGDVVIGTIYGFVDGAIGGWLLSWLYNYFAGSGQRSGVTRLDKAA